MISNIDLVNKVSPTDMADPSLYTAALEYHIDASLYRGPMCQLVTRKCHKVTCTKSKPEHAEGINLIMISTMMASLTYIFCNFSGPQNATSCAGIN